MIEPLVLSLKSEVRFKMTLDLRLRASDFQYTPASQAFTNSLSKLAK